MNLSEFFSGMVNPCLWSFEIQGYALILLRNGTFSILFCKDLYNLQITEATRVEVRKFDREDRVFRKRENNCETGVPEPGSWVSLLDNVSMESWTET